MPQKHHTIPKALLYNYRNTGTHGTTIHIHRALRKLIFSPNIVLSIIVFPVLFDMALWYKLDAIMSIWSDIFDLFITQLNLNGHVAYINIVMMYHNILIPYPNVVTSLPNNWAIWTNIVIVGLLWLLSTFMPKRTMPFIYLLRVALIIQMSASVYFFLSPDRPPLEAAPYVSGALSFGVYFLFLISPLLALVYYIFDITLWRKCIVTLLMIIYFIIALPFQYMLHSYVIGHWSMLFMPLLYLLFGVLLDTLMLVCWYSLALSWRGEKIS